MLHHHLHVQRVFAIVYRNLTFVHDRLLVHLEDGLAVRFGRCEPLLHLAHEHALFGRHFVHIHLFHHEGVLHDLFLVETIVVLFVELKAVKRDLFAFPLPLGAVRTLGQHLNGHLHLNWLLHHRQV